LNEKISTPLVETSQVKSSSAEVSQSEANRALVFVSLAVFFASSVWFSGTAAIPHLEHIWNLSDSESVWLTIAVQLGFIAGTFFYAASNIADRFNARRVFLASTLLGAAFNACFAWLSDGIMSAIVFRFFTGVTLAGVYPVGMKIVASWFQSGLGWRLGVLVGSLTFGKASPYLIELLVTSSDWRVKASSASIASLAGGVLVIALLGDGPYLRGRALFDPAMLIKVFKHRPFRYTAFGYFGHMWELYAYWSLINFYLTARFESSLWVKWVPLLSFLAIGAGVVGCLGGGWLSRRFGERKVALVSLIVSATCCAVSGFAFDLPPLLLMLFVLVWGIFVISDSPQFSALAARLCPPAYTGTALTTQNGLGFAVTVFSIQLLPLVARAIEWRWAFTFLTIGPIFGAYFISRLDEKG
jgi:MFS family permease